MLRDLVSRTSLIVVMYQRRSQVDCGPDEHADIVAAIAAGDAAQAMALMDHHMDHLEGTLDLDDDSARQTDLKDLLQ